MRTLLIVSLVITFLYGCDTGNVQPEVQLSPQQRAESLLELGQYGPAATEFLQLSESYPEQAQIYQLKAADAYIKNKDLSSAETTIKNIVISETQQQLIFYRNVLSAEIALLRSQPEIALKFSPVKIPEAVGIELVIKFYETRANSHGLLNDYYNAALEYIKLDALLLTSGRPEGNTNAIWSNLVKTEIDLLNKPVNRDIQNLTAWIELAFISKSLMTRTQELRNTLQTWQENNPDHPATSEIISNVLKTSERFDSRPAHIALLLPLSGIYERYSERIRDGFLSAWFYENNYRPQVQIYDTDQGNFTAIYQQAISDGADFIIGPLEKESVRLLAEMDTLPVRTLALNQVDVNRDDHITDSLFAIPDLVQFGLPPEDEARQVAERGILEGYNRALVITSADDYGNRVFNAFSEEWLDMGGRILERVEYNPQTSDFVTPIKKLLNIDSSETRIATLRQKLGRNLLTNSRLREDIEFVFIVATNLNARQIVPHLRFFRAEGIPIYTISSVYTGKQNPQVDNDLNGVEFVDIPWLLGPELHSSSLSTQIEKNWESTSSIFPRYYAFGVDAFRLISQIGEMALNQSYRYSGETGALYMTADGVIHRKLLWARFNQGVPEPLFTEINR